MDNIVILGNFGNSSETNQQ